MVQQLVYIGKSRKSKIPHTLHFSNIRIPKPPYISSLKIIRLLNFLNFLGLSEENYNLQSLWITLYHKKKRFDNDNNHKISHREVFFAIGLFGADVLGGCKLVVSFMTLKTGGSVEKYHQKWR